MMPSLLTRTKCPKAFVIPVALVDLAPRAKGLKDLALVGPANRRDHLLHPPYRTWFACSPAWGRRNGYSEVRNPILLLTAYELFVVSNQPSRGSETSFEFRGEQKSGIRQNRLKT